MGLGLLPPKLFTRYHIEERRHAAAVLNADFPAELQDIIDCLNNFRLLRSEIEAGGGGKSRIANRFDLFLSGVRSGRTHVGGRGWREQQTKVSRMIGTRTVERRSRTKWTYAKGESPLKSSGTTKIHSSHAI